MGVVAVASAIGMILMRDLFKAALFLVVTFVAIAGLFLTLNADFLAVVQVLIYAGAISILLIFAILLTRDVQQGNPSVRARFQAPALFLGVLLMATLVVVFLNTQWPAPDFQLPDATTSILADTLFNRFVLPFEIASVLLLAAILGAIVLAREPED